MKRIILSISMLFIGLTLFSAPQWITHNNLQIETIFQHPNYGSGTGFFITVNVPILSGNPGKAYGRWQLVVPVDGTEKNKTFISMLLLAFSSNSTVDIWYTIEDGNPQDRAPTIGGLQIRRD